MLCTMCFKSSEQQPQPQRWRKAKEKEKDLPEKEGRVLQNGKAKAEGTSFPLAAPAQEDLATP